MHVFDARVRGRDESGLEVRKLEDNARQTLVPDTPAQVETPTTPPSHAECALNTFEVHHTTQHPTRDAMYQRYCTHAETRRKHANNAGTCKGADRDMSRRT